MANFGFAGRLNKTWVFYHLNNKNGLKRLKNEY